MGRHGSLRSPPGRPPDGPNDPQQPTAAPPNVTPASASVDPAAGPRATDERPGRSVQFVVYLTREERTRIGEYAREHGMKVASYLRLAALGRKLPPRRSPPAPVPEINRVAYHQLAQIGNNLNQLARWANIGDGEEPEAREVLLTLDALIPVVRRLQLQMIGTASARGEDDE